jgi:hypothetical protein
MATVYRQKVERLAAALAHEDEDQREAARSALRGFIDQIVIPAMGSWNCAETWGGCWQQPQENATVRSLRLLSNVVAGAGFEPATFGL